MPIPLFWRLILGYAAILLLSVGTSVYSIVQLGGLSQTARDAIDTDYRTIAHQETLTDAFLSEARYGGKYLITQAPASYDQFRQFKNDFLRYLGELKSGGVSGEITTQLVRVDQLHRSYHDLFEQEVRYLKAGQPYAQSRYQQERDKILENTLRELARLKDLLEKNVHDKLEHMSGTARAARTIAIATTLILLVVGTALSLKISASVTKPLVHLKRQTQDESSNPESDTQPSTIPEIQELSDALAQRMRRLQEAAETNGNRMERATEDLAARLSALKSQLTALKTAGQGAMAPSIDKLIGEADRLAQDCAELNASAAAHTEVLKLRPHMAEQLTGNLTPLGANHWRPKRLPQSSAVPLSAVRRIAERGANLFTPLARQLGLHKSVTNKHGT